MVRLPPTSTEAYHDARERLAHGTLHSKLTQRTLGKGSLARGRRLDADAGFGLRDPSAWDRNLLHSDSNWVHFAIGRFGRA